MGIYQVSQIRAIEHAVFQQGVAEFDLMQRAGESCIQQLQQTWPKARSIIVLCGGGNNAGDGYVIARLASLKAWDVKVFYVSDPQQLQGAAQQAYQACRELSIAIQSLTMDVDLAQADVLIDALLGIGLQGQVREPYRCAIQQVNQANMPILSVDIPSGLCADTGVALGIAVEAQLTVTMIANKLGLLTGEGVHHAGNVYVADLDIDESIIKQQPPIAMPLDAAQFRAKLPKRRRDAHKGDNGHVLVVGGDIGMSGAVRMAAEAAARVGAGLVSIATQPQHAAIIASTRPELMCHGIENETQLIPLLKKTSVLVLGPGLGLSEWSKRLYQKAIASDLPMIVDADALNLLANNPRPLKQAILTPHPGEAGRLLQLATPTVQHDRYQAVQQLTKSYHAITILKGAGTLIADSDPVVSVCTAGNPGMASGGMGDVLSGILGGLVAQGLTLESAAKLGVCLHAQAADAAAKQGERGLLALDVIGQLRRLVN